jgi:hypothetical protein
MATAEKIKPDSSLYWLAIAVLLIILGLFGSQAIEWVLTRLYDFFIQKARAK